MYKRQPLLYDLTALQKEANGKLDFSADKTLIMCCAAYEMKRLGLANKPLITGLRCV